MNPTTARFLFDECLGKPVVEPITKLVGMGKGEKPKLAHLLDFVPSGTMDEVWISRMAADGWTLITSDGGRKPNKRRGTKLPLLCATLNVTHVILSPAIQQRTAFEKVVTLFSVWYELIDIADDRAKKGNRYALEPALSGVRGAGRLIERPLSADLLALRAANQQSEDRPGQI